MSMLDDIEVEVRKIALDPDDVLVLRAARPISSVVGAELRAQVSRIVGPNVRVMVADPGLDVSTVALGPDAVLVLTPPSPVTLDTADKMLATAKRMLGADTKVLVLDPQVEAFAKPARDVKAKDTLRLPLKA